MTISSGVSRANKSPEADKTQVSGLISAVRTGPYEGIGASHKSMPINKEIWRCCRQSDTDQIYRMYGTKYYSYWISVSLKDRLDLCRDFLLVFLVNRKEPKCCRE